MRPISYSLQFRGQATLNAERVRLDLSAPGAALVTTIDALGVQGRLGDLSGGQAVLRSELSFDGESFTERGSIDFGRGHTLRFCSVEGRLADSPDPHLRHGAVVREVDGGEGQFAGAEGLITSNLLISDTGDVTDNHFGLVFVHSSTPEESCHEIRTR